MGDRVPNKAAILDGQTTFQCNMLSNPDDRWCRRFAGCVGNVLSTLMPDSMLQTPLAVSVLCFSQPTFSFSMLIFDQAKEYPYVEER